MHIMTANGWRQLTPRDLTPAEPAKPYNGVPAPYVGVFPSIAICALHNEQKSAMMYFDDGVRMVYGKADKIVAIANRRPKHPIPYPPAGVFNIVDDQD